MRAATSIGVVLLSLALSGFAVGCSEDEPGTPADTTDTGADTTAPDTTPVDDTGTVDTGVTDAPVDGDAGPLDFAEFVKGLIKTETTDKAPPTTVDDKTFVDKQDQSQFSELFP